MKIGVLAEIKTGENRVAMTPAGAEILACAGHQVLVQSDAGKNSGFENRAYLKAGATIAGSAKELFDTCDMVLHVKEPQPSEYGLLREGQVLFTYLHLAASEPLTRALLKTGAVCLAYE
ncbi:MAG: alanine dehydrogenase, partial [Deltaproteobacteria bacterium]|nr:alanine dehydrogenase [Deltaproteobacteria bacterium]